MLSVKRTDNMDADEGGMREEQRASKLGRLAKELMLIRWKHIVR